MTTAIAYNVANAYTEIMADNGQTWIGEFAKRYNKQHGTLFMDIMVYAQSNNLPSPALVVMLEEPKRGRRSGANIQRNSTNGFSLAHSRLVGTALELATEIEMVKTEDGILLKPITFGNPTPVVEVSNIESVLTIQDTVSAHTQDTNEASVSSIGDDMEVFKAQTL